MRYQRSGLQGPIIWPGLKLAPHDACTMHLPSPKHCMRHVEPVCCTRHVGLFQGKLCIQHVGSGCCGHHMQCILQTIPTPQIQQARLGLQCLGPVYGPSVPLRPAPHTPSSSRGQINLIVLAYANLLVIFQDEISHWKTLWEIHEHYLFKTRACSQHQWQNKITLKSWPLI